MIKINKNKIAFLSLFLLFFSCSLLSAIQYQLPRINEAAIEEQVLNIEKNFKRNSVLRYVVLGTGSVVTTAVTSYLLHHFYHSWIVLPKVLEDIAKDFQKLIEKVRQSSDTDNTPVTVGAIRPFLNKIEDLRKVLIDKLKGLKSEESSWILQTIGSALLMNFLSNTIQNCQNVFKNRDFKWFINTQTHVGSFMEYEDQESESNEQFTGGLLLQELKISAKSFDELEFPDDSKKGIQNTTMLCSVCSSLIKELITIVAFMRYTINTKLISSSFKSDAECFEYYLIEHTNRFCQTIEHIIAKKIDQPQQKTEAYTMVMKYVADIENTIIGFVRVTIEAAV
ncbi:hypothetical protein E3J79_04105 [Candidatus Dependentiae bacterium]|nr:MAG: hypothetical protein E3J79_04105 [Candidatus Dependentiae bacterium]